MLFTSSHSFAHLELWQTRKDPACQVEHSWWRTNAGPSAVVCLHTSGLLTSAQTSNSPCPQLPGLLQFRSWPSKWVHHPVVKCEMLVLFCTVTPWFTSKNTVSMNPFTHNYFKVHYILPNQPSRYNLRQNLLTHAEKGNFPTKYPK